MVVIDGLSAWYMLRIYTQPLKIIEIIKDIFSGKGVETNGINPKYVLRGQPISLNLT